MSLTEKCSPPALGSEAAAVVWSQSNPDPARWLTRRGSQQLKNPTNDEGVYFGCVQRQP